jgi:hypothetical protein
MQQRHFWTTLFLLAPLAIALPGCSEDPAGGDGAFGASCEFNSDCASGICAGLEGSALTCVEGCEAGCPSGSSCIQDLCIPDEMSGGSREIAPPPVDTGDGDAGMDDTPPDNMWNPGGGDDPGNGAGDPGNGGGGDPGNGGGGDPGNGGGGDRNGGGGDPGNGVPEPGSGNADCPTTLECLQTCANENCVADCFGRASAEAAGQVNDIGACVQSTGCEGAACQQACADEIAVCVGGPGGGGGVDPGEPGGLPGGQLDCPGIFACFEGCADEVCAANCIEAGTPEAQGRIDAIGACIERSGCQGAECDVACNVQIAACFGEDPAPRPGPDPGPGPAPAGDSCPDVLDCLQPCLDQDCAEACFDRASPEAGAQLDAIGACIQASGCEGPACNTACAGPIAECYGEPAPAPPGEPGGALTCEGILDCANACNPNDRACIDGCIDSGTADAQAGIAAIGACVNRTGCESDAECSALCGAEVEACVGGGNPGGAPTGCAGTLECFGTCADDLCAQQCVENTDAQGQVLLDDLLLCVQDSACQGRASCQRACPNEFAACEAD